MTMGDRRSAIREAPSLVALCSHSPKALRLVNTVATAPIALPRAVRRIWIRQNSHSLFIAGAGGLFSLSLAIDLYLRRPGLSPTVLWLLLGFALFRLFDITKPWPVRWADRWIKGGWGIMFDDLLAAGYAWLAVQAVRWLIF